MGQWNLFDVVNGVVLKFPAVSHSKNNQMSTLTTLIITSYLLIIDNYYYNNNYKKSQELLSCKSYGVMFY